MLKRMAHTVGEDLLWVSIEQGHTYVIFNRVTWTFRLQRIDDGILQLEKDEMLMGDADPFLDRTPEELDELLARLNAGGA